VPIVLISTGRGAVKQILNGNVLDGVGTDPKWTGKPGKQARFVARSMAGARWGLKSSSSREIIRLVKCSERKECFEKLKIRRLSFWWLPAQEELR
jgi:hypothetical protein